MSSSVTVPEPQAQTSSYGQEPSTYDVEKIVSEIISAIHNDPDLESFDVIPEPTVKMTSPVLYVDHNLGLESWCVGQLYSHVHTKALIKISDLENQISLITVATLINPHVRTFWNMRRDLVQQKKLDFFKELRHAALVLSFKPKAQEAFNYRKWLLKHIFEKQIPYSLMDELAVVQQAAERHQNNHTAWDHCLWLLSHCPCDPDILVEFWRSLVSWISIHVSDASAMNFQQQLIKKLINCRAWLDVNFKCQIISFASIRYSDAFEDDDLFVIGIVLHDFELTEDLIVFYRGHEALWYHRRFLSHFWINVLPEKVSLTGKELLTKLLNEEGVGILEETFSQVHEMFLLKIADLDYIYAERYEDWLQYLKVRAS